MLRKEDAVVGKRVVWRSLDTRLTPTFGTIIDVTDSRHRVRRWRRWRHVHR